MKTAESVLKKARANNEPVLVLRAQDECAAEAIYIYFRDCEYSGCSKKHTSEILKIYNDFRKWQMENPFRMKLPD